MDLPSTTLTNNLDSLLFPDNERNNNSDFFNSPYFQDQMNGINMDNQNGNPTELIQPPFNSPDLNYPFPSHNSPILQKKTKRDENSENSQTDRLKSDSEEEEEEEKEEEASDNKFSKDDLDNQSFKLNFETRTKSFTKEKIEYPTKKELKDIKKIFSEGFTYIKDYNKFLNTLWRNIPAIYKLNFNSEIQNKFFGTCPKDYIEEILKEEKSQKDKELFPISPEKLKYIFDNNRFNNSSYFSEDLNINVESNRNKEISLDEIKEFQDENTKKIETEIINRIDNLFDRLKTMINTYFIDIFNSKVEKENKLPTEINNYIIKIKGKEDNIKFLENNFKDNITFFGKDSAQYHDIQTTIERIYKNQIQNKEAIELLEIPVEIFLNEIMGNEDLRQKFFDEDREMKIKEVKNDKCRIIANSLKDKKGLKGQIKLNGKKNYIVIKDVNEFIIRINKIKGYENYGLCFTNSENEKIEERTLILENLGDNPMLYLKLIEGRAPRNSEKKEKKSGIKNMFSVKK